MTSPIPSQRPDAPTARQDQAVNALLQLREARSESARAKLQTKQVQIAHLEREIERIKKRKLDCARGGGCEVLQERLLLDAWTRVLLARERKLRGLRDEAATLLDEYVSLRGQRDSVKELRDRRAHEIEYVKERRAEEAACDAAAARTVLRPTSERGEP